MAVAVSSPPEHGQLVSVRSRNWIVNEVAPSALPTSGLHGVNGSQTLLTLSSIEDDGLGEEIRVIWELEPGCRIIEKVALPDPTGFDPPDQLNAFEGRKTMSTTIGIDEAQAKLKDIIAQLGPDDEVVITDHSQPVAKLIYGQTTAKPRPKPGLCKGMLTIVSDDDEHLEDFKEYMP